MQSSSVSGKGNEPTSGVLLIASMNSHSIVNTVGLSVLNEMFEIAKKKVESHAWRRLD